MYFFSIKREKVFIKYMEILEKVQSIIKNKFISELTSSKKYLTAEKKTTKEGFHCLSAPVILIDSIYRKHENYHAKVFLEKYYFIKDIEIYCSNHSEEYDEDCINFL